MKAPTGISGLDEVTGGGLPPAARPSSAAAGCGKTLSGWSSWSVDHGVRRARRFVAFEDGRRAGRERRVAGLRPAGSEADGLLVIDHVNLDPAEIEETGDWDLDGLFIRLGAAIDAVGAKRVVLDTIETLFGAFRTPSILRSELRRLFGWLKDAASPR